MINNETRQPLSEEEKENSLPINFNKLEKELKHALSGKYHNNIEFSKGHLSDLQRRYDLKPFAKGHINRARVFLDIKNKYNFDNSYITYIKQLTVK